VSEHSSQQIKGQSNIDKPARKEGTFMGIWQRHPFCGIFDAAKQSSCHHSYEIFSHIVAI